MSAAIGKFFNPATYATTWAFVKTRAHAYYHPMIRANSATPLFHSMMAISVMAYSTTLYARIYAEVQEKREQKRVAMAEYYEKHGGGDHH